MIYEDVLVTFAVFIILIMLATFVGVANEPKADPSDAAYIPRPEWYFLFLFQMLKYFPGSTGVDWDVHPAGNRRRRAVFAAIPGSQSQPAFQQTQAGDRDYDSDRCWVSSD